MSSILTNNSAMVALQTLKSINSQLGKTQSDIATGKTVANAKDNAAVWAISKVMETDQSSFKTIQSNLNVADAVTTTARTGAEKITQDLKDIKALAATAGNSATASESAKIRKDIELKFEQIASVINGTQMNGVNLLKGGEANLTVLASLDRGADPTTTANVITVENVDADASLELDLATGASTLLTATSLNATTFDAVTGAATDGVGFFINSIETAIDDMVTATANLGSSGKQISDQSDFVGKLSDSLKSGIGALVDADMEEASARLQALQTQQQLGIQALSIANQGPSAVMSLFR